MKFHDFDYPVSNRNSVVVGYELSATESEDIYSTFYRFSWELRISKIQYILNEIGYFEITVSELSEYPVIFF